MAKQACLICGRRPADAHHPRFAQQRALGRKVSDEFTVPLCRGHHREAHRSGDEAAWWKKAGIDPTIGACSLWLETHPLPTATAQTGSESAISAALSGTAQRSTGVISRSANERPNDKARHWTIDSGWSTCGRAGLLRC